MKPNLKPETIGTIGEHIAYKYLQKQKFKLASFGSRDLTSYSDNTLNKLIKNSKIVWEFALPWKNEILKNMTIGYSTNYEQNKWDDKFNNFGVFDWKETDFSKWLEFANNTFDQGIRSKSDFFRLNLLITKYIDELWWNKEKNKIPENQFRGHPGKYDFIGFKKDSLFSKGSYYAIEVKVNTATLNYFQRIRLGLLKKYGFNVMVVNVKISKEQIQNAIQNGKYEYEDIVIIDDVDPFKVKFFSQESFESQILKDYKQLSKSPKIKSKMIKKIEYGSVFDVIGLKYMMRQKCSWCLTGHDGRSKYSITDPSMQNKIFYSTKCYREYKKHYKNNPKGKHPVKRSFSLFGVSHHRLIGGMKHQAQIADFDSIKLEPVNPEVASFLTKKTLINYLMGQKFKYNGSKCTMSGSEGNADTIWIHKDDFFQTHVIQAMSLGKNELLDIYKECFKDYEFKESKSEKVTIPSRIDVKFEVTGTSKNITGTYVDNPDHLNDNKAILNSNFSSPLPWIHTFKMDSFYDIRLSAMNFDDDESSFRITVYINDKKYATRSTKKTDKLLEISILEEDFLDIL